jgi:hypothetical protein
MRGTVTATTIEPREVRYDARALPYPPGAVSRFLAWVDRLPGRGWWMFPGLALGLLIWAHAILWASGRLPVGSISAFVLTGVVYGPYALATIAYSNRVALRSLAAFWPATGWPDVDRPLWAYRFVTSPGGFGLLCLAIGVPAAIGSFQSAPEAVIGPDNGSRPANFVAVLPCLIMGYSLLPAALVHFARQLRLVSRIHREAKAIDPFDRIPLYAFSRLTVQIGLALVLIGYYSLTVNGEFQAGNAFSLAALGSSIVAGIVCFIVPLWGIHDRLVREKESLLREVEARLSRIGEEFYRRVDEGAFDSTKVVSDALSGVTALRDRIVSLPTWPWPPQLFRGFLSALFLPVLVFLVSRVIAGQIGT